MRPGTYQSRTQALQQIAAAVIGSAAAAQSDPRWVSREWAEADHSYHTHERGQVCRCTCNFVAHAGPTVRDCPEHGESAFRHVRLVTSSPGREPAALVPAYQRVLDAAREYARTGGQAHHELMDAVAAMEQAEDDVRSAPDPCYCGTGRVHERGTGYHCRATQDQPTGDTP